MRPKQFMAGAALLMLLLLSLSGVAQATVTFTNNLGMTYTGPGPGAAPNACVDSVTHDYVSITNVGPNYTLRGQFTVLFINADGSRTLVGTFVVGTEQTPHVGDLNNFQISYPPVSQWPLRDPSTGLQEIHVDLSIGVYSISDPITPVAIFGPNVNGQPPLDWDLNCFFKPTNTPTNTPTDTPTRTPTNTPTHTPTNTPTRTPTNTPSNTPTDTPTQTPTNTSTDTPTDTPTKTPTDTPTDTRTDTPTKTPRNTRTHTPTLAPTDTPTQTPQPPNSPTPTAIGVAREPEPTTAVPSVTTTPLPTGTQVPTRQPEEKREVPSQTPTASPTDTPTATATMTQVLPTATRTATQIPVSPTATPTTPPPPPPNTGGGFKSTFFTNHIVGPKALLEASPLTLATNFSLALILATLFGFFGLLLYDTLESHEEDLQQLLAPLGQVANVGKSWQEKLRAALNPLNLEWLGDIVQIIVALLVFGLVYSFVDPSFSFSNPDALPLLLAVTLSFGLVNLLDDIAKLIYVRRLGANATVRVHSGNLVVAGLLVIVSRLASLTPGLLTVGPGGLEGEERGEEHHLSLVGASGYALPALVAWLLLLAFPIEGATGANLWVATVLSLIFAIGLQTVFFEMIPIKGLYGRAIFQRNRPLWFVLFAFFAFLFAQTQLNPDGVFVGAFNKPNMIALVWFVLAFCLVSLAVYIYFQRKDQRGSPSERPEGSA